ncbi:MAG: CBS domain-containing protein, partial [Polyangiaceae bacterium]
MSNSTSQATMIRDWMTPTPHSIGRDQSLALAHEMMNKHKLRHLPVLELGKLVGILSQRDLLFLEAGDRLDLSVERVEDAMTQEVFAVPPNALLSDVVAEMLEHKYGSAVVVDGRDVAGIFTTMDALLLLEARLRTSERVD